MRLCSHFCSGDQRPELPRSPHLLPTFSSPPDSPPTIQRSISTALRLLRNRFPSRWLATFASDTSCVTSLDLATPFLALPGQFVVDESFLSLVALGFSQQGPPHAEGYPWGGVGFTVPSSLSLHKTTLPPPQEYKIEAAFNHSES